VYLYWYFLVLCWCQGNLFEYRIGYWGCWPHY